jgi:hypothetical protein
MVYNLDSVTLMWPTNLATNEATTTDNCWCNRYICYGGNSSTTLRYVSFSFPMDQMRRHQRDASSGYERIFNIVEQRRDIVEHFRRCLRYISYGATLSGWLSN